MITDISYNFIKFIPYCTIFINKDMIYFLSSKNRDSYYVFEMYYFLYSYFYLNKFIKNFYKIIN